MPLPAALIVSACSGLLLSLSQPPLAFGPIAFLALVPLVWLVRGSRPRRAAILGLVFGLAYFTSLLYWVIQLSGLGWGALSIVSAAYPALFGLVGSLLWRDEHPIRSTIGLAALWAGVEYLRSMWPLGGFTWGGLGYSQTSDGFLLPLASITGVWGVSFVVALVNGFVLLAVERIRLRRVAAAGFLAASLGAVMLPALTPIHAPDGRWLDVAIVQGNDVEARLQDSLRIGLIATKHATLHVQMRDDPPDLAVWPEDAVDADPTIYPSLRRLVTTAVRQVGAPTLVGAITGPIGGRQRNQSLLYDGEGTVVGRYTKVHLVPFGEFVPWRRHLSFISALQQIPVDLTPGTRINLLYLRGIPFANVICFENSFPSLDRRLIDRGARFLVVSTNNASYGRTAASRQHLAMSQLRAVENGRWVVHAAVSGISAFVDPHGRVHQTTGLYQRTIDRRAIRLSKAKTIYTRWGDWFPWASLALSGLLVFARRRRRGTAKADPVPADARTLVILPTYEERATIGAVISRVLSAAPGVDILVVDDSSPDGTAGVVRDIAEDESRVTLLERDRKDGLAGAYLAGFRLALERDYDLVVEMDADLSHQPEELPSLLEAAGGCDLVVGSRYVPGGSVTDWGFIRRALSRGGNVYARLVLGLPVADATSGFRVYRRELLQALLRRPVRAGGYGFQIELAYRAWLDGYAVGEAPITFREREHGHSKISRRIIVEALWLVTVWGLRDRLRRPRDAQRDDPNETPVS
ncbi:MAG: apolipoprotein N-acyltransferase [Actinomycetota bacterium]